MAIKLQSLKNMLRTVTVIYDGDRCAVTYRVGLYTPAYADALNYKASLKNFMAGQICDLVEHWELVDGEGKEIPPTPELVETLPQQFLNAVMDAIRDDIRLPKSAKNS